MPYTEFYVQPTGSNVNAGSTTADAAAYTATNGGWDSGTGVFTPASGDPSASVAVGDFASVYNDGATVAVFVGRVTAVNSTTITVSTTAKSGTAPTTNASGRSIKVGGAWAGPSGAVAFPFNFAAGTMTNASGHIPRVNFKNGTNYAITAAIAHNSNGPAVFQGYTTTVGDGGRAVLDGGTSGASYLLFTIAGTATLVADFEYQNNGATGSANGASISSFGTHSRFWRCVAHDVRGSGFYAAAASNSGFIECEAYACNQSATAALAGFQNAVGGTKYVRCISHDNPGSTHGFTTSFQASYAHCIADSNGGDGFIVSSTANPLFVNCDAFANGSDGVEMTAQGGEIQNCNFVDNAGYGINSTGTPLVLAMGCGFGAGTRANGSGTVFGAVIEVGSVTYANDVTPWADPDDGDFRIVLAAAKNAGRGSFLQTQSGYGAPNATVAYSDIGAGLHTPDFPAAADVESGVTFDNGDRTGTFTKPNAGDVRSGTQYGGGGTQFTGTLDIAADNPKRHIKLSRCSR